MTAAATPARQCFSRIAPLAGILLGALCVLAPSAARAVVPVGSLVNQIIRLDGTPLGSATANRSAAPTIQYANGVYHMWVQVQDEGTASDLRIAGYRHATSTDGIAFTTQGTLSFAGDPFAATLYGSTFGEPPWIYPRATLAGGGVTFQFWTYNTVADVTGDYNYNLSINTIAAVGDLALTHYGPVGTIAGGIPGQTAGGWGIVNGNMYYDNNSSLGRTAVALSGPGPFPATAGTGPNFANATSAAVFDPLTALGYVACHLPGGSAYLHNGARVIDNGDGTLGFFFTIRNCDGTRKDLQVYYAESADDGATWGTAVGIFAAAPTIGANALFTGISLADVAVINGQRIVYFNAFDAAGNLIVGAMPPLVAASKSVPVPALPGAGLALMGALLASAAAYALRRRARTLR